MKIIIYFLRAYFDETEIYLRERLRFLTKKNCFLTEKTF